MKGSARYAGHADRLLPLRRYIIAAVATLGRPDAIMDMRTTRDRGQWHPDMLVFDLNPTGRLQTKKYRAVVPAGAFWPIGPKRPTSGSCQRAETSAPKASRFAAIPRRRRQERLEHGARTAQAAAWLGAETPPSLDSHLASKPAGPPAELKLLMGHEALEGSQKAYVVFAPDYLARSREVIEDIAAELRAICPDALIPPDM